MNLSVIIPAFNHLPEVLTCLNTLYATKTTPVEFIVEDDASTEYDGRMALPWGMASVDRNAQNLGFAGNCNAGAARAHGDFFFFVNQDVQAMPNAQGWDAAILAAFDDPAVGIVGARLLFENGSIQSAGGLIDARGTPFHRCIGYSDPGYWEVSQPREVTWVTGAALAIRADLFRGLGGFDPFYAPSYFEDVDICLRAREAGYKTIYEPRCTLIHRVGSTGGSPFFARSALKFKQRWVDSGKLKPDEPVIRAAFW